MRQIIKKILLAVVTILILTVISAGGLYWKSLNDPSPVEVKSVTVNPETSHIGDIISIGIVIELPWSRRIIGDAEFNAPDGLQVVGDDMNERIGLGFGSWKFRKVVQVQAYDFGPFSDMEMTIPLTPNETDDSNSIMARIPEIIIESSIGDDQTELLMAAELSEDFLKNQQKNQHLWYIIASVIVIAAILITVYFLTKDKKAIVIPPKPWVTAESALMNLQEKFPLDAETVFVELTDIIRKYIEAVFKMPATESTTPEFLRQINVDSKSLNTDQKLLLTDFLTAADMVKFARVDATQEQIDDTLQKAKRFIVETSEEIIKLSREATPSNAKSDR